MLKANTERKFEQMSDLYRQYAILLNFFTVKSHVFLSFCILHQTTLFDYFFCLRVWEFRSF